MTSIPHLRFDRSPAPGIAKRADSAPFQRQLRLLEGQTRVIECLVRGADSDTAYDCLASVVQSLFPDAACALFLSEPKASHLQLVAAHGLPDALAQAQNRIRLRPRKDPAAAAAYRGEPVIAADIARHALCANLSGLVLPLGFRAIWAHPILNAIGETLGVINLYFEDRRAPNDEDHRFIDALAAQASLIIEHGRRSDQLRSADERFSSLAASIPGVVYQRVVTPDGDIRYTYISEAAEELFEVSPEEIVADPNALFARHGPSYREDFRERLLKASRDLTMWDVEAEIVTRSGKRKWTHALARPVRQPDGSVVWNGVILDATRIKLANLELAAASRAKSDFLANMSHELRTPLNAIIGFSEMILGETFGPVGQDRYLEYANDIRDSGAHLLEIINDILDIAKVEAGTMVLNEEAVDVAKSIRSCLKLLQHRADEGGIALRMRMSARPTTVWADARKFKQIVVNLLSNAIKFTPAGGRAHVKAHVNGTGELVVTVSDTGPGIPEEYLDDVMSPFVQLDSGLNRKHEGTGLGLPLCKALVEAHGGQLELRRGPHKGTVATVRFPPERLREEPVNSSPTTRSSS